MLPGVLLFVHIATACAHIKSYDQENFGRLQSRYSYRNRHIYPSVSSDIANWNIEGIENEVSGSDAVQLDNKHQVHEGVRVKDDTDKSGQYLRKRSKGENFVKYSNNLNYNRRSLIDWIRNGRKREDRTSRNIREVKQEDGVELYNGLPVWSYLKPEKNTKLTNRNGNISHDNAGESTVFYDGEETTTEEVDLANRMAFEGRNCASNYAKVFKKCVRIR